MLFARAVTALLVMLSVAGAVCARQAPADGGGGDIVPAPAEARLRFDIPAQALDDALQAYSKLTGWSLLYDAPQVRGLRSAAVRGEFTVRQAIERMVAGSGMAVRYTSSEALLLVPMARGAHFSPGSADNEGVSGTRAAYYAWLQLRVTQALCGDPLTTPGRQRVALRFAIGPVNTIESLQVRVTGHPDVEARVRARLSGLPVGLEPPVDLRMPVTMVIMPRPGNDDGGCGA